MTSIATAPRFFPGKLPRMGTVHRAHGHRPRRAGALYGFFYNRGILTAVIEYGGR